MFKQQKYLLERERKDNFYDDSKRIISMMIVVPRNNKLIKLPHYFHQVGIMQKLNLKNDKKKIENIRFTCVLAISRNKPRPPRLHQNSTLIRGFKVGV